MNGNFEKDGAAYPFAYLQNGTVPSKTKPGQTESGYNLTDMRSLEKLAEHTLTLKQAEWAANGLNMKLRNGEFKLSSDTMATLENIAARDAAIKDAAAVLAVKAQNTI